MFSFIDTDHSGTISFDEFLKHLRVTRADESDEICWTRHVLAENNLAWSPGVTLS